jgi:hypothetical protein
MNLNSLVIHSPQSSAQLYVSTPHISMWEFTDTRTHLMHKCEFVKDSRAISHALAMRHAPCAMRHAPCAMRHAPCAMSHEPRATNTSRDDHPRKALPSKEGATQPASEPFDSLNPVDSVLQEPTTKSNGKTHTGHKRSQWRRTTHCSRPFSWSKWSRDPMIQWSSN